MLTPLRSPRVRDRVSVVRLPVVRLPVVRLPVLLVAVLLVSVVPAGCADQPGPDGPRAALTTAQRSGLERSRDTAVVAIIDGVVDRSHPALRDAVAATWRAPGLADTPSLHAAQMLGVVAGRPTDTFSGGIAPTARVLVAEVLEADGAGQPEDVASALAWVRDEGADVVLMSLAVADDPAVARETAALVSGGVVVVAAAGNGFGDEEAVYPADYPGVLSVTAYDRRGGRLALAHWARADVAVAGEDIAAPAPGGSYAPVSGTSAAAAVAAGLIAACGDHRPVSSAALQRERDRRERDQPESGRLLSGWAEGSITFAGRPVPRLGCPVGSP